MANRFRMTAKWTGQPERRCPANVDLELYPSLRCSVRTLSESFWRQGQNETQTPLNPGSKHQSRVVASRPNVHEASQRAARKIHGPGVRLRERLMVTVWPVRTTRSSPTIPQHIWPLTMNASPPNICFSLRGCSLLIRVRTCFAKPSSNDITHQRD